MIFNKTDLLQQSHILPLYFFSGIAAQQVKSSKFCQERMSGKNNSKTKYENLINHYLTGFSLLEKLNSQKIDLNSIFKPFFLYRYFPSNLEAIWKIILPQFSKEFCRNVRLLKLRYMPGFSNYLFIFTCYVCFVCVWMYNIYLYIHKADLREEHGQLILLFLLLNPTKTSSLCPIQTLTNYLITRAYIWDVFL